MAVDKGDSVFSPNMSNLESCTLIYGLLFLRMSNMVGKSNSLQPLRRCLTTQRLFAQFLRETQTGEE